MTSQDTQGKISPGDTGRAILCEHLMALGRERAASHGLVGEEQEDCALGFLAHMLAQPAVLEATAASLSFQAWLCRCAENWVHNFLRQSRRVQRREVSWSDCSRADAWCVENTPCTPDHSPETVLLLAELRQRLLLAAAHCAPSQQELFVRHFLQERSLLDLAAASGRTPDALRHARRGLRYRLQVLLQQQGLDAAEACTYLMIQPRSPARRRACPEYDR
jgi:DNA-directed RNA polymerase specialized sigma24 family protein